MWPWPFDLIFIDWRGIVINYPYAKFGDCIFSHFGFIVWKNRQTHTHTELQTLVNSLLTQLLSAYTFLSHSKEVPVTANSMVACHDTIHILLLCAFKSFSFCTIHFLCTSWFDFIFLYFLLFFFFLFDCIFCVCFNYCTLCTISIIIITHLPWLILTNLTLITTYNAAKNKHYIIQYLHI